MEQSPSSEADRFVTSQEIPCVLCNPKVYCRIHKCPPPVPILSQLDSVHNITSHFMKIHSNIILPSTHGSPKCSLSLRFPHQNPLYAPPLFHTRYMPHPSHSSRFYHPNNIGWAVQRIMLFIMQFLHSPVTSSLLGTNILLNTIFLNTLSQLSSFNVSDQVPHPYKTTGKNIYICISWS